MQERIEKRIELKAPVARVWRALTDYREFGEWFRVKLDGPFVPGQISRGQITYPGYEHVKWQAIVQKMEPQRLFSFTWHHSFDPKADITKEPTTLVEFRLEKTAAGTRLTLTESGFENLPADLRCEAFRRNDGGWTEQMKNIERHVRKT
ncbi:MAG TPA: SRPBCC family protein [Candidatus Cybelea sp.]|nr:SRPBCC family protein [Candidatus Cybelea sp.]